MTALEGWALFLPVGLWAVTGIAVAWAFRRSAPTVLLRLAATFLALWSLLATTAAVWLLSNGGWPGLLVVERSPASLLGLFSPARSGLWVEGGLGALGVLVVAFVLNQAVGVGLLRLIDATSIRWPSRLPHPPTPTQLLAFRSVRPEAFSFTLLDLRRFPVGPLRSEFILVSTALLDRLDPSELEAVVAHELGHLLDLDGRYLTFLRTLSRMMRWDPVLAYVSRAVTRREEYRADDAAVGMTGRPLALARALFKASVGGPIGARPRGNGFLGGRGELDRPETLARIRRLVAMAEAFGHSEGPGG